MDVQGGDGSLHIVAAGAVALSGEPVLAEVLLRPQAGTIPVLDGVLLNDGEIPAEVVYANGNAGESPNE